MNAFVLIRNIKSEDTSLECAGCRLDRIDGSNISHFQKVFGKEHAHQDDWALTIHLSAVDSLEDLLFALRLYRVGDIRFVRVVDEQKKVMWPYRLMNNGNNPETANPYPLSALDPPVFAKFFQDLRTSQSWNAGWFQRARNFFSYGATKDFDVASGEVDRIVDYATALEATLSRTTSMLRRNVSRRGATLIAGEDAASRESVAKELKEFYDIRSKIVHGSRVDDEMNEWLETHMPHMEQHVRNILKKAVKEFPSDKDAHHQALRKLYEPNTKEIAESVCRDLSKVKDLALLKSVAETVAIIMQKAAVKQPKAAKNKPKA